MIITEFATPEELIKVWKEASMKKKEYEEQEEVCKKALVMSGLEVPIDQPVFQNIGIEHKERKTYEVPKELLQEVVGENQNEYLIVDKKKFDQFLKDGIEQGYWDKEWVEQIKARYTVVNSTEFYQLKEFK